jgi:protocatechuate 3,4-dioxygenase alpha subunit
VSNEIPLVATASQTVGPFFSFGLTTNQSLGHLVPPDSPGQRIRLLIRLLDGGGMPVPDAMIEIWHASGNDVLFGRLGTNEDGMCSFETVYPVPAGPEEAREAAHVNLCVFMRGLLRHLYTRLYFPDEASLTQDAVLAAVPEDRRGTLMAYREPASPATWRFDLHLQGARETVYFDL